MSDTTDDLIRRCFDEVLALDTDRRESYFRDEIGDEHVRREVRALLEAHEEAGDYLEQPPTVTGVSVDEFARWTNPDAQLVGETIGHCRLQRLIASGGMGTVFEAEQDEPRRTVAVKLLRRGLASDKSRQRFEYETQVLARLRHPGIARIYEAGSHKGGDNEVPYFVMEYITNAESLTAYATSKEMSLRERLELFIEVCDAVHYGHLQGVIHRDLKPENILVDEEGRPRIIDFGVAKATDHDLAITTLITESGQFVGTLQYMSPEQCDGDASVIDLRSDVYSLGVILYELLCGSRPYDLTDRKPLDAIRIVRERNSPPPSDTNRMLRGDLDTIVLKTLAKERERRYESAAALASDLHRYLDNEPIAARPPSAIYQLRKFARRNRTLVGSSAIIALLLVTGIISTSVGWNRATQAEAQAVLDARRAETVIDLINNMLESVDPHANNKGIDYTLREMLVDFELTLGDQLSDEPLVEATLRQTLGNAYSQLDLLDDAVRHLSRALELRQQHESEDATSIADTMADLAAVHHDWDHFKAARDLIEQALSIAQSEKHLDDETVARLTGALGEIQMHLAEYDKAEMNLRTALEMRVRMFGPDAGPVSKTKSSLAYLYQKLGRYEEALVLLEDARAITLREHGEAHPHSVNTARSLAGIYEKLSRYDEAERLHETNLEAIRRMYGDSHSLTASYMRTLADVFKRQSRYEEAESLYVQALAIIRDVYGEDSLLSAGYMQNLALLYSRLHRFDEAEPLFEQALALNIREWGETNPSSLGILNDYALMFHNQRRYDKAIELYEKLLEFRRPLYEPDSPQILYPLANLANALMKRGDLDRATTITEELLDQHRQHLGEENRITLGTMTNLGIMYSRLGRNEEAESLLSRSLSIKRRVLGTRDQYTQIAMDHLARLFQNVGRIEEAMTLYEELLPLYQEIFSKEHRDTLGLMTNLGNVYRELGLYDKAEAMLTESLSIKRRVLDPTDFFFHNAFDSLGTVYEKQGREDEFLALKEESLTLRRETLGVEHRRTLGAMTNLGSLYTELGRYAEAEKLLTESVTLKRRVLGIEDQWTRFAIDELATLYELTDRRAEAIVLRKERLDYLIEQAQSPDAPTHVLNEAAWQLLTHEHEELHDAYLAFELAQRAVAQSETEPALAHAGVLDTLALALFRTGDVQGAVETQRRTVELSPDDEGFLTALARYEATLDSGTSTPSTVNADQ